MDNRNGEGDVWTMMDNRTQEEKNSRSERSMQNDSFLASNANLANRQRFHRLGTPLLALVVLFVSPTIAHAGDGISTGQADNGWTFSVSPYL
jgi:hypothetical protein